MVLPDEVMMGFMVQGATYTVLARRLHGAYTRLTCAYERRAAQTRRRAVGQDARDQVIGPVPVDRAAIVAINPEGDAHEPDHHLGRGHALGQRGIVDRGEIAAKRLGARARAALPEDHLVVDSVHGIVIPAYSHVTSG